jgi:hypothetical protein
LGLDYDYLNQSNFRVCPLVAYAICAVWLALGLKTLLDNLKPRYRRLIRPELLRRGTGLLVVAMPLLANAADNYRATDTWAEEYARTVLDSLEPNAVLFTQGDTDTWTIGYVRYVLGLRPDVTLYSVKGIVYANRLFRPYALSYPQMQAAIDGLVRSTSSPVYYTNVFPGGYGETDYGLFKAVHADTGREYQRAVILPAVRRYMETLLARGEPVDNWEKMHYRILTAMNCLQSVRVIRASPQETVDLEQQKDWVAAVCSGFQGRLLYIGYLLELGDAGRETQGLIEAAEDLKHQAIAKSEIATLEYYKAEVARLREERDRAAILYENSWRIWPHPENPARRYVDRNDGGG